MFYLSLLQLLFLMRQLLVQQRLEISKKTFPHVSQNLLFFESFLNQEEGGCMCVCVCVQIMLRQGKSIQKDTVNMGCIAPLMLLALKEVKYSDYKKVGPGLWWLLEHYAVTSATEQLKIVDQKVPQCIIVGRIVDDCFGCELHQICSTCNFEVFPPFLTSEEAYQTLPYRSINNNRSAHNSKEPMAGKRSQWVFFFNEEQTSIYVYHCHTIRRQFEFEKEKLLTLEICNFIHEECMAQAPKNIGVIFSNVVICLRLGIDCERNNILQLNCTEKEQRLNQARYFWEKCILKEKNNFWKNK